MRIGMDIGSSKVASSRLHHKSIVVLSAAKGLLFFVSKKQILRCAQDDTLLLKQETLAFQETL
jgi:hypothetical protein